MIPNITPVILVKDDAYFLPYMLESIRGLFERYVIYDIGSRDSTTQILRDFMEEEKWRAGFFVRWLPMCSPEVQGIFRNSMIAEAQNPYYFICDGDEVYRRDELSLALRTFNFKSLNPTRQVYGVFDRIEVSTDLTKRYNQIRGHHRIYHYTAIWRGPHPGERPVIPQKPDTEFHINVTCLHLHNAVRSPLERQVPQRAQRKSQKTYHPGELIDFDILKEFPVLQEPIKNYPINPALAKLQEEYKNRA